MELLDASLSKYNLSITFTIYSKSVASDNTVFTKTKERPFGLRNLQGDSLEEHIRHALQIMDQVAQELHHLTGFGIDNGRMKQNSTTIKEIPYPQFTPKSDESLWYSYDIALKFRSSEYKWVNNDGMIRNCIEETEINNGWSRQALYTGRTASFHLPAATEVGCFHKGSYKSITYNAHDPLLNQFLARFDSPGNLGFGQDNVFGLFEKVNYDYWPQAKNPEKYFKKLPRKSRLATQATDNTEYVYIIKVSGQNIYKIGKSNDPQGRLNNLQTSNPHKLKLVHTFKADNASTAEETLHELLHHIRMEGEWFHIPYAQSQRLFMIERFEHKHFWIDNQAITPQGLFNK